MKILIAEDDPVFRRLLEVTLTDWGYEVQVTCDGRTACQALEADDPPPLALLDWMLPEMDGLEICRRVRSTPAGRAIYIILLTTRARKEDVIAGLDGGADDYITKPFDREELRARLRAGCRIVELQSSLAERMAELEESAARIKQLQRAVADVRLVQESPRRSELLARGRVLRRVALRGPVYSRDLPRLPGAGKIGVQKVGQLGNQTRPIALQKCFAGFPKNGIAKLNTHACAMDFHCRTTICLPLIYAPKAFRDFLSSNLGRRRRMRLMVWELLIFRGPNPQGGLLVAAPFFLFHAVASLQAPYESQKGDEPCLISTPRMRRLK